MPTPRQGPAFETPGPEAATLNEAHAMAEDCRRCDLYRNATHLVFGEGPPKARVLLLGEQPGDKEDMAGAPFVGPSGQLLDRCLEKAGIDRGLCYVTNAVKHFKFEPRGKRRIHSKPNVGEIQACAWWLAAELRFVRPKLVVALGATALHSLLGRGAKVMRDRGTVLKRPDTPPVLVTIHPSALLRTLNRPEAAVNQERFVADLAMIADFL